LLTVPTVLTELTALPDCFGRVALILMIRVPLLPSRVNAMRYSMLLELFRTIQAVLTNARDRIVP